MSIKLLFFFVKLVIKYKTVKTYNHKDYTASSRVSDIVSLNHHQTRNLNIGALVLYGLSHTTDELGL